MSRLSALLLGTTIALVLAQINPVLNEAGEIIGIHGQGDLQALPLPFWKPSPDDGKDALEFGKVDVGGKGDLYISRKIHSEVAAQPEKYVPARYHRLRDLLLAGKWEKADVETLRVMLQVAGRLEEGWLENDQIENFPCEDLRAIDKLWVKYSNGRF
ncbi:MAG: GUN4 domain-containing protein [Hormoscilla sp. SP12CHS1]|nr:GUN4 domain-containing protein [Hormoscilla sp. SP12CHS1]